MIWSYSCRAKHFQAAPVDEGDHALAIDKDPIVGSLHQVTVPIFTFLQGLLCLPALVFVFNVVQRKGDVDGHFLKQTHLCLILEQSLFRGAQRQYADDPSPALEWNNGRSIVLIEVIWQRKF